VVTKIEAHRTGKHSMSINNITDIYTYQEDFAQD
jgi:hypothetical protein